MENRIYKRPPINEMYMSIHFQARPVIGMLDFDQFALKIKGDWPQQNYIFPFIENIGSLEKVMAEPEKIWFQNEDETKILQFIRDRMVYNWRVHSGTAQDIIYPKYESIKTSFLKYWSLLSSHIKSYAERRLTIKMFELYYSNILPIGEGHFLKSSEDLHKALSFISAYPENHKNISPQIHLQIPIKNNTLILRLDQIKDKQGGPAFFLVLLMRSPTNQKFENLNESWYDDAHEDIYDFFQKITTEDIKTYWKTGDTL